MTSMESRNLLKDALDDLACHSSVGGIFLGIFSGCNPSLDQLGRCLQPRVDIYQMEPLAMANCLKKTFLSSMLPFHLWKHLPWHLPFGQSNPLQVLYCLKHRHVWYHSQAHGMTNLVATPFSTCHLAIPALGHLPWHLLWIQSKS